MILKTPITTTVKTPDMTILSQPRSASKAKSSAAAHAAPAMPPKSPSPEQSFVAFDWKPFEKNGLKGFFSVETPSGLIVSEISLHEKDGKRWIGMPSKQWTKPNGDKGWLPLVQFRDWQAKERFQRATLAALDKLLDKTEANK